MTSSECDARWLGEFEASVEEAENDFFTAHPDAVVGENGLEVTEYDENRWWRYELHCFGEED